MSNTSSVNTSRLPTRPAYLTWGDPINDPPSALGQMTFDAVLSEAHECTAEITSHPVESGLNITDNVRPNPDRLTLEVFVSNTPIRSPDAVRGPITLDLPQPGQGGFLTGGTSALFAGSPPASLTALADQFFGDTDYVARTLSTLTTLKDSAMLVQALTPNRLYASMLIQSVDLHRDSHVGTVGIFTITMVEIRTVSSSIVCSAAALSLPRKPLRS